MKKIVLIIALSLSFSCSKEDEYPTSTAFNGELVWTKTFGGSGDESIHGVAKTMDGGFVVVGYTKSNDGDITDAVDTIEDIWLTKYNADGNLLWSKTYGGSADDYGYSVVENNDGTLTVAGYSLSSDADVPSNLGMHDFFIFKTDASGNLIWSKSHGYTSHDHAHKLISTTDGGYLVVGFTDYSGGIGGKNANSILHGVGEYYMIKLDANGNKVWDNYFGGTQNDRVFDAVQANDGGYILVGYSESSDFDVTDNHGSYDYWVIKTNSLGQAVWKKSYGGSELDQAYGIVKSIGDTYLIVGTSNSTDGDISSNKGQNDVWMININDQGDLLWQKSFGGSGYETANSIRKLQNGNFLIAGHSRSNNGDVILNKGDNDFWAFTITPSGKLLWQATYGGSSFDLGYDAVELSDKSIVIVGETQSIDMDVSENKGGSDLMIVKVK